MTKKSSAEHERPVPLLFDPEQLGRSLREVAVDVIETDGNMILTRWFHSKSDADLLIWTDEDLNVIKHQVNFFGQVVEWNVFEGVKTGLIVEEEVEAAGEGETSELIHFDLVPETVAIRQAVRLLEHVSELKAQERQHICDNLLLRANGTQEGTSEFIRRYGEAYKKERNRRPTFWRRLKKWFSGTRD